MVLFKCCYEKILNYICDLYCISTRQHWPRESENIATNPQAAISLLISGLKISWVFETWGWARHVPIITEPTVRKRHKKQSRRDANQQDLVGPEPGVPSGHQTQTEAGIREEEVEKSSRRAPWRRWCLLKLNHTESKLARPGRGPCSAQAVYILRGLRL